MKGGTNKSTVIVEDFNTSLSVINRSIRQKISSYIDDLNNAIGQIALFDICINSSAQGAFLSSAQEAFPKKDHILVLTQTLTNLK